MRRLLVAFFIFLTGSAFPAYADTYDDADKAYEAGDYEKAKSILLPLAKAGSADAMNLIGLMYQNGYSFSKDDELACDWYEKAANAGDMFAQSNLGLCYKFGEGRTMDWDKAIFWKEKAASQGEVDSLISLAHSYAERGDREKATYWGQKAVDAGSALGRVTMWTYDLPNTGLEASRMDIACVMLFNNILDRPWNYCD